MDAIEGRRARCQSLGRVSSLSESAGLFRKSVPVVVYSVELAPANRGCIAKAGFGRRTAGFNRGYCEIWAEGMDDQGASVRVCVCVWLG